MEAFHMVSSWPVKVRSLDKDISDSICSSIKSICSDFSSLKKVKFLFTSITVFLQISKFPITLEGTASKRRDI